ncbi:MAG: bile acid:sodium symporter family protein [Planctomycetaceae bacterium]
MLQRFILIWLIASSTAAFYWPKLGIAFDPFLAAGGSAIHWLIVVTMFCVGAVLPVDEVRQIRKRWPNVLIGTAIQYISMPLLAWLTVLIMKPEPQLAAGIIIVGCVPGAMASNVLTLTARGNVSYSVSLTTMATLLSPLIVPRALQLTMHSDVPYDGNAAVRLLLLQVVLPVVTGHVLRRFSSRFLRLADRFAATIANLTILAIIAIAVGLKRADVSQATGTLLMALACMNAGGYLCGYLGGRAGGLTEPMRRALTLEVGMQNAGAGVALAQVLFGPDSPAIIPCIVYTFGCMLTGTILATVWHRFPPEPDTQAS